MVWDVIGYIVLGLLAIITVVGGLVLTCLLLASAVICLMLPVCWVGSFVYRSKVRRRMRTAGRWLTWGEALQRIEHEPGTLIVESPTAAWNVTYLWWTPDDVLALAPADPPVWPPVEPAAWAAEPFTIWCHATYTHLVGGSAYLLAVFTGQRKMKRLRRRFANLREVPLLTGLMQHYAQFPNPEGAE